MIKIYSTSWCPDCIKAKKYFNTKGVNYSEINVADSMKIEKKCLECLDKGLFQ